VIGLLDRSTGAGVVQRAVDRGGQPADRDLGDGDTQSSGDPYHCPAGSAWLMRFDVGRVSQLRLFHQPHAA
jgi:hypothetical protein